MAALLPCTIAAEAPAPAGEPPGLLGAVAARSELRLGAAVLDAAGIRMQIGGLRLDLDSGSLRPVVDGEGRPLGFTFRGKGRFRFQPDYPDASRVARHNVRALLGEGHLRNDAVVGSVERALAIGRAPGLPRFDDPAASVDDPGLVGVFRSLLESYRRTGLPRLDHHLTEAEANGRRTDVLHLEMQGSAGDVLFVRDPARQGRETLFKLQRRGKLRAPLPLAVRPLVDDPRRGTPADYKITSVQLEVVESGGRQLDISGELEIVPLHDGLRVLRFALRNHQAGPDIPWDRGKRRVQVTRLEDGAGRSLAFSHRYHELLAGYPETLAAGRPVKLVFGLRADIAVRPSGNSYFLLRTLPWFPRSPVDAEAYRMDWRVSTASPFLPLVSGDTRSVDEEDGRTRRETTTRLPVRYGAIVAGKFHCQEFSSTDVRRLRVCSYLSARPRVAPDVASFFGALAAEIGALLVPYPFSDLTIVEIPTVDLAQSTPGMILLSSEILLPNVSAVSRGLKDAADSARSRRRSEALTHVYEVLVANAPKRMAHELAHTWWGQIVKYRDPGHGWLSESFAEYFGALALASIAGDEVLDQLRAVWRNAAVRANAAATLHTAHLLSGPDGFSTWWDLMYGKGPLVIDAMRAELGDERFFASLRRFLRDNAGDFATTEDLAAAIRAETGRDLGPLLERQFYGGELP